MSRQKVIEAMVRKDPMAAALALQRIGHRNVPQDTNLVYVNPRELRMLTAHSGPGEPDKDTGIPHFDDDGGWGGAGGGFGAGGSESTVGNDSGGFGDNLGGGTGEDGAAGPSGGGSTHDNWENPWDQVTTWAEDQTYNAGVDLSAAGIQNTLDQAAQESSPGFGVLDNQSGPVQTTAEAEYESIFGSKPDVSLPDDPARTAANIAQEAVNPDQVSPGGRGGQGYNSTDNQYADVTSSIYGDRQDVVDTLKNVSRIAGFFGPTGKAIGQVGTVINGLLNLTGYTDIADIATELDSGRFGNVGPDGVVAAGDSGMSTDDSMGTNGGPDITSEGSDGIDGGFGGGGGGGGTPTQQFAPRQGFIAPTYNGYTPLSVSPQATPQQLSPAPWVTLGPTPTPMQANTQGALPATDFLQRQKQEAAIKAAIMQQQQAQAGQRFQIPQFANAPQGLMALGRGGNG